MISYARARAASKAAAIHFLACLAVAGLAAALVFWLWFPGPYLQLAGGIGIFALVVGVDIVCGPLLTLVLYDPSKGRRELVRDLSLVLVIQLAALIYGLTALAAARPVHLVFEVDRFRVVTAADVDTAELSKADAAYRNLPWTGPRLVGIRTPKNAAEQMESIELSMAGIEPSLRPGWWQPYELTAQDAVARGKPLSVLAARYPVKVPLLQAARERTGESEAELVWIPVVSRRATDWIALLRKSDGAIKSFEHVDGFSR